MLFNFIFLNLFNIFLKVWLMAVNNVHTSILFPIIWDEICQSKEVNNSLVPYKRLKYFAEQSGNPTKFCNYIMPSNICNIFCFYIIIKNDSIRLYQINVWWRIWITIGVWDCVNFGVCKWVNSKITNFNNFWNTFVGVYKCICSFINVGCWNSNKWCVHYLISFNYSLSICFKVVSNHTILS